MITLTQLFYNFVYLTVLRLSFYCSSVLDDNTEAMIKCSFLSINHQISHESYGWGRGSSSPEQFTDLDEPPQLTVISQITTQTVIS